MEDTRNVIDKYKNIPNEDIRLTLKEKAFPFAVCMQHVQHDFNLGTVLRNANAFGAREAFYYGGRRHRDRRSSLGVHHYTDLSHIKTIEELKELKKEYVFVGIDNIDNSVDIHRYSWPKEPTLMLFGEEGGGLLPEIIELCRDIVMIKQYGSVRSLNVGTASGIIMNDYVTKYREKYEIHVSTTI